MTKQERQRHQSLEGLYRIESGQIAKVIQLQEDPKTSGADIERALKSLKYVEDLIVVREWIDKLGDTIASNPSVSLPPGTGQGSTSRRLQALQQQMKKAAHRDQRKTANQQPETWADVIAARERGEQR